MGPSSPHEAMGWIKEAARRDRLIFTKHLVERFDDRDLDMQDLLFAIRRAVRVEPYAAPPENGGTCWRVHGKAPDSRPIAVGVEAFISGDGRAAVVCTIFVTRQRHP